MITPVAHTGVDTATAARGTTSTTVDYPAGGVGDGYLAIISAVAKPTVSFDTISGWTFFVNTSGGTGTQGADVGQTRMGGWRRVLDGTESGSVTVSAPTASCVTAAMSVYATTGNGWASIDRVTGNDSTHGTNPSATLAAWPNTLTAGEVLHLAYATDTDSATATGAVTLTQTGASFGTVTARNRLGNSSGDDSAIFTWSAPVISGSANALTFDISWAASSCGTLCGIRIKEITGFAGWGVPL